MAALSIAALNHALNSPKSLFSPSPSPPPLSIPSNSRRFPPLFRPLRATGSAPSPSSSGLYSSVKFDLTIKNVDIVLDDVRPYLIADGGNVDVVSVEDGVISLKLQGACGSCPSSTTTMQMGIERVLKEKFGEAVKEIQQVFDEETREITAESVNRHLDILRPAISNFGGSVEVLSVKGGECAVKYVGPESIGSGIKAAIKEKFPVISNVIFTRSDLLKNQGFCSAVLVGVGSHGENPFEGIRNNLRVRLICYRQDFTCCIRTGIRWDFDDLLASTTLCGVINSIISLSR